MSKATEILDKISSIKDKIYNYINSIHVDYRGSFFNDDRTGLINQGLAISTEIHNPYKDKMENGDEQLDNAFEK